MGRAYDAAFARGLTRVDPEKAHRLGFRAIRTAGPLLKKLNVCHSVTPLNVWDLTFPGRLGLAAGFDKNAEGIDALAALGFSHIEIGTVTGEPQPGNEAPRLFRLPRDRAVINRMGFNNHGAAVVARRLRDRAERLADRRSEVQPVLGINIGKTKLVSEEDAAADYAKSAKLLSPYADYLVVNVSSPNTPGLRNLQAIDKLEPILEAVRVASEGSQGSRLVPLLVKIAPDLADEEVAQVGHLALRLGLDGVVATNTTIARHSLRSLGDHVDACGAGGLSGAPLTKRAQEVIGLLRAHVGPDLPIVGVGGIGDVAQARGHLAAGATLLQAYTGFIYGGPGWPSAIQRGLES